MKARYKIKKGSTPDVAGETRKRRLGAEREAVPRIYAEKLLEVRDVALGELCK